MNNFKIGQKVKYLSNGKGPGRSEFNGMILEITKLYDGWCDVKILKMSEEQLKMNMPEFSPYLSNLRPYNPDLTYKRALELLK